MDRCSGRVEVLRGETWGTVCDVFWDLKDASVVCNHLHCGPVLSAKAGAFFGEGNGSIWKDVTECRVDHWHLRLAAGEGRCDGRVEVYQSGVWGRVTDDLWDFKDADVVCRQLKCGSAVNVYNHGKYGIGKGHVIMSNVSCIGIESYLWNCTFTQTDHIPLPDVGVFCSDDIPVRLVNGSSRCAGRVEVYYNGIWGTVCDDAWDITDADVVCKELNCGHAVNATKTSWFGQGSGPIWLDNLKCSVNNTALWQCPARPWGQNDCSHKEDAGVICSGHREIRLENGKNPCQGRLEVFFNGTWGTVCSDLFGIDDAEVVCSQLNCGSAKFVENNAAFGEGTGPIWLDDVRCRFGDSLLWQCPSSAWGQHNCRHQEDVGISCSDLRLVAGFDNCSGRIEVFFSGTWGTVCDDSWDRYDATVVCRQLNCGDPFLTSVGMLFPPGDKKSRPSIHKFAEPFYEEIVIQETGPGVESPLPLEEHFGEEYDDIE
ncbi:deleted in malignant brain tumors 1 protein-like [Hypanus sabinus]|uniref:deleted in malignant brain tumors 1 protein-like n=1 Tax=Hypanus sabinus TaxID=79690 RepID=UPI0028C4B879|nr:deleted in malignant brain tumors 1 protein-like [Hypanus sabinus]